MQRRVIDWLFSWPVVAMLTFVVYGWTTSRAIGWLDSPEFVAAAGSLGISHSPGHPLPSFLGRLIGLLPIGDLTFRANLSSALAGVGAALATYWAIQEALRKGAPTLPIRYRDALSAIFVVMLVFSAAIWNQSVRAEVYALETALLAAAAACVLRFDRDHDVRFLHLAGLATGLALANHHFLAAVFFLPTALFIFARRQRPTLRQCAVTAAFGMIGLAAFLYLPVRSLTNPAVNWGAPHTLSRFLWTISGRAFQKSAGGAHVSSFGEDVAQIVYAFGTELTLLGCMLALLALYVCCRTDRFRFPSIWLTGCAILVVLARAWLGFDPNTPDHHSYLSFGLFSVVVLSAVGVAVVLEHLLAQTPPRCPVARVGLALAAVLGFLQLARGLPTSDASTQVGSDILADWELRDLPPRSLVLLAYNQTSFRVQAQSVVDHARPDITFLDRSFLTYPGQPEQSKRRHPELAKLIDAPLAAGRPTPIEQLREIARTRPVWMELHFNLDPPPLRHLVPIGKFARFMVDPPSALERDIWEPRDRYLRRDLGERLGPILVERHNFEANSLAEGLLWLDAMAGSFYCTLGRKAISQERIQQALSVHPDDAMLLAMELACQP